MDITVVIPAYNAGVSIARALDSVARQSILPQEIIVVDDGSTDETAVIARNHPIQRWVPLKVHRISNSGVSVARNTGIRIASTSFIAFLDADDEFLPTHLEMAIAANELYPGAVVYWSGIERVFDNDSEGCKKEAVSLPDFGAVAMRHVDVKLHGNHYLMGQSLFEDLIRGNFIQPSSSVVTREIDGVLCLFNEHLHFAEDRIFFLEQLGRGVGVFTNLATVLVHRDGTNASTTTDQSKLLAINFKVICALEHAKSLLSIRNFPRRVEVLNQCIEVAHRDRIYLSSFHGVQELLRVINNARKVQQLDMVKQWFVILKCMFRALGVTFRKF